MNVTNSSFSTVQSLNRNSANSINKGNSETKQKTVKSVYAASLELSQDGLNKSKQDKYNRQIQSLTKQKEELKESNKDPLAKKEELKAIEEQIIEIQKQMMEANLEEQKQEVEKAEVEVSKNQPLTEEAKEEEVRKMEMELLTAIAVGADSIAVADKSLSVVKQKHTEAELGTGPKYGGNLSSAEISSLYADADKAMEFVQDVYSAVNKSVEDSRDSMDETNSTNNANEQEKTETADQNEEVISE